MRIIVCGDREWIDPAPMVAAFDALDGKHTIIHGAARGADRLAAAIAERRGHIVIPVYARWNDYGVSAGPIRNREMLREKPDEVWVFHDDLYGKLPNGRPRGSMDMVAIALAAGVTVYHYSHAWTGRLQISNGRLF